MARKHLGGRHLTLGMLLLEMPCVARVDQSVLTVEIGDALYYEPARPCSHAHPPNRNSPRRLEVAGALHWLDTSPRRVTALGWKIDGQDQLASRRPS